MVELDSYSNVDWLDSGVNRDKTQAPRPNSSEAKTSSRLAASFTLDTTRVIWRGPYSRIAWPTYLCEIP